VTSPSGPGVRDDSSAYPGVTISSHYDPLVSKLSTWGPDRAAALARMRRALGEYRIAGIRTNLAFHERLMENAAFAAGNYDTGFIAEHEKELLGNSAEHDNALAIALAVGAASLEASPVTRPELGATATLSPWVASHRARLRKP
jgi:acetyl-CoA carboxylase biotin carboxylase subunit